MTNDVSEDRDDDRLSRALRWALTGNAANHREYVEDKRLAFPEEPPRLLAERIVRAHATKGATLGFVTGLASNPFLAAGGALADVATMLKLYASITARVGLIADEEYFANDDWENDVLVVLAGPVVTAQAIGQPAIAGGKHASKVLIKDHLSKAALKALKKGVLKWFGKKVTQRAVSKAIPIVGSGIGAMWNYNEIQLVGNRIIRYQFEGTLE
jgi:hypothetical protein